MKILVTGSTGLIGRELCKKLVDSGYEVAGLSRHPEKTERFKSIKCDISKKKEVEEAIIGFLPEVIIHTAATLPENKKTSYYETNVLGTYLLLFYAKKYKIKKFIYLSTGNVYSLHNKLPIRETDPTDLL